MRVGCLIAVLLCAVQALALVAIAEGPVPAPSSPAVSPEPAYRKTYFREFPRMLDHECVRIEKPQQFAEVLLAEDRGWTERQVKELWGRGVNNSVTIERRFQCHRWGQLRQPRALHLDRRRKLLK